jgi:hypothetical protein
MLSVSQLAFVLDGVKRSKVSLSCQLGKNLQFGWKRKRNYVKGNNDGCQRKGREGKVPGKVVVTKIQEVIDTSLEYFLEPCTSFQIEIDHVQSRNARSMNQVNIHYKNVKSLQTCR